MTTVERKKLKRHFTDADIMEIMHQHTVYRLKKMEYDERYPNGIDPSRVPEHQRWMVEYYNRPLMSDEEFLRKLREEIGNASAVTTAQVAAINQIRAEWEFQIPILRKKQQYSYTLYKEDAIRARVYTTRARIKRTNGQQSECDLIPLTHDEQRSLLGHIVAHANLFALSKVLSLKLGRWDRPVPLDFDIDKDIETIKEKREVVEA